MAVSARAEALPACPLAVCDGSGWILGPEDVARPCECRARTITRARLRGVASVIPSKYRGVSFQRPPVTEMNAAVVRPVKEFCMDIRGNLDAGRGLWMYGGAGTGKTTLAMLVSRHALDAGRSVAIYSMPKLLARIRRTYDAERGEQSYAELFERLTTVDLLHIDDLGAENRTEWVLEQLYALINERYEAQRSLVVTTNKNEGELDEQIGARVVSRLVEMSEVVPVFDEDRRWRPSGE
ncbi:MAG TPA: ATP-binding protein [Solirubrobacterales bacterium]|nr:ATP-binding protein [Solirubrobacterales bacterium]